MILFIFVLKFCICVLRTISFMKVELQKICFASQTVGMLGVELNTLYIFICFLKMKLQNFIEKLYVHLE